jgi:isopenicillin N synthase-like dioxygenase
MMNGPESYEEPADIPVIDFGLLHGTEEERNTALKQLDESFQSHGFIYLSNHLIPQKTVDQAFDWVSATLMTSKSLNTIDRC